MYSKVFCAVALLCVLTGCAAATPTPQPALTIWTVNLTPTLGWMTPAINQCARSQPETGVFLREVPVDALDFQNTDISLTWGTVSETTLPVFELGTDQLSVIVHPGNPVDSLAQSQLEQIIQGEITTWQQADVLMDGDIAWWLLPAGDETRRLSEKSLAIQPERNPYAWMAPDADAVVQSVAADPLAIGIVPARWLSDSVKSIQLIGLDTESFTLPILAVTRQQPDTEMTIFLACLQNSLVR